MSGPFTRNFEEVQAAERDRIATQRQKRGVGDAQQGKYVGLALSGGGLRSSSFALGVLQALDRRSLLPRVDYLSTVSGGGYIGSALTWFRRKGEERFPFGTRGLGVRRTPPSPADAEPSQILGYLQQHRDYLTPAGGSDAKKEGGKSANFGATARSAVPPTAYAGLVSRAVFLSLLVYGSMLVLLFGGLEVADRVVALLAPVLVSAYPTPTWSAIVGGLNTSLFVALVLVVLLALAWIAHPIGARVMRVWRSKPSADTQEVNRTYTVGLWSQRVTGNVLGVALIAAIVGSVPVVVAGLRRVLPEWWPLAWSAAALIAVGVVLGISTFRSNRRRRSRPSAGRAVARARWLRDASAGVLMLYSLLALSHIFAVGWLNSGALLSGLAILFAGVGVGWLADLNQMGIARTYRDRLMEAFLPGARATEGNRWLPAFEANVETLESMCGEETVGPYQLLNANLITLGSRATRFRSRGSDSFVLSPLFCGSDATGWRRTGEWMGGKLTLSTAMAISGPTARPAAPPDGRSWHTRLVSGAMFALGLRMGYWARNPSPKLRGRDNILPNYLDPGLVRAGIGRGRHEGGRFIELADGGDFDDLGIYELIRRRVDVIVAADASADGDFSLDGLANVVARARVDFGVEVDFPDADFGLDAIRPGSGQQAGEPSRLAKRGFAVGTIRYTDEKGGFDKSGVLLYVKATVVPGLPPDVLGYRDLHPEFPYESGAGAGFGEDRFEAYRELGYRVASELIEENARRGEVGGRKNSKETAWL